MFSNLFFYTTWPANINPYVKVATFVLISFLSPYICSLETEKLKNYSQKVMENFLKLTE